MRREHRPPSCLLGRLVRVAWHEARSCGGSSVVGEGTGDAYRETAPAREMEIMCRSWEAMGEAV
jgi:hypothetical protein